MTVTPKAARFLIRAVESLECEMLDSLNAANVADEETRADLLNDIGFLRAIKHSLAAVSS